MYCVLNNIGLYTTIQSFGVITIFSYLNFSYAPQGLFDQRYEMLRNITIYSNYFFSVIAKQKF